ncbi:enoyl-CoA hydratase [Hyphobacterium sp. HN65]|uniref:Enoyl-CoA hydratase n=1 Tax=Hyphobacterium lacteum TaxID=3116575 RepID=A0ABU7LP02_9PROT|nr:enoyl-CoA hydratase [Hyphobacterium sp. HN65]MEE2525324.1 enoyl-CoA hydratase [Hyphobacterium sp. HN65]
MSQFVTIETSDGVRTIRWNRPDKKNALLREMYTAAAEALESGETEKDVKVFILGGTPGLFTAGNDLVDFMEAPPHIGSDDTPPVERFMRALMNAKKPVIAEVDGLAIGIGTTLLMHCDLAYASENAAFKTPFVDLALAPEFASSLLFPTRLGRAAASDLLMLGTVWTGERAKQAGLVTDVFPSASLSEEVRKRALALAAKSPGAVRMAKQLMLTPEEPAEQRMTREGAIFAEMLQSPEFAEAVTAFMERRAPDFSKFG